MNKWYKALEFDEIIAQVSEYCAFSLGKEKINELKPSFSKVVIQRENAKTQDAITYILSGKDVSLTGVSDVSEAIIKASKGGINSISEMVHINRTNHVVARLIKSKKDVDAFYVYDYIESLDVSSALIQRIDQAFSPSFEVLETASKLYGDLKKQQRELEKSMSTQVQAFINKHMSWLSEPIATTRHDRVVVLAKTADKNKFKGILHGESASGQSAYVEPPFLVELNNKKEQIQSQIEAEVHRICVELSAMIKGDSVQLLANLETLAQLDACFAKAHWGLARDGFVANVDTTLPLRIEHARHPLIDPKVVVANTYELEQPNRILLITGPNTGGKTVSVKIIGLFTLMAYSGIPVLASSATIPLFDCVFADIGDDQSIVQSLSTFSSHLSKISQILQEATRHSLVLLDELGSGTDPDEGESLAIAILDYLREKECTVVATTHFNRLKEIAYESDFTMLASVEFDLDSLSPTYRYVSNTSGASNALAIASRFNMPETLLQQAKHYFESKKSEQQQLIDQLHQLIDEQNRLNATIKQQQEEQRQAQQELERVKAEFEANKEAMIQKANKKAQDYLQEQLEEIDDIIKQAIDADQEKAKQAKVKLQEKVTTPPKPPSEPIQVGDHVQLIATHQIGVVSKINQDKADVEVHGKRFSLKLNQLEKVSAPIVKKVRQRAHPMRVHHVELECVIVGMRSEAAKVKVDQYINDCILANRHKGYIVHGVGTGVLKKVIKDYLSNHPGVIRVQAADHQEGGAAVTVVMFQ
jgi:DNA mismatch repair protein MutS2